MATREQLIEDFADHKYATGEKFARLINSMKVVQEPVETPAASGTSLSFIDSIEQDKDGKITATKKTLDLSNVHELNPFKGWWKTGDTLPTSGFDGAYLYFKDTTQTPVVTTIYRWNGTAYVDTGTEVDESNVQTFATGQAVNTVGIDDEPAAGSENLVKSGGVHEKISQLDRKLIELVGINSTGAGVTKVGDVYYNTYRKLLRICTVWTGQVSASTFETVPFYDGAIYTYNNELYVWNGTDLVKTVNVGDIFPTLTPAFESGTVSSGSEQDNPARIRTIDTFAACKLISVSVSDGYLVTYARWNRNNRFIEQSNFASNFDNIYVDGYIRFIVKKSNNANIEPTENTGFRLKYIGLEGDPFDVKKRLIKLENISGNPVSTGKFFYSPSQHVIKYANSISSVIIPFLDGAIYTYNNELYVWNGTDLVKTVNVDRPHNLFYYDIENVVAGYYNTEGIPTPSTQSIRCEEYFRVIEGKYKLSNPNEYGVVIIYYDKNKELIDGDYEWKGNLQEFTIPSGVEYIRFAFNKSGGITPSTYIPVSTNKEYGGGGIPEGGTSGQVLTPDGWSSDYPSLEQLAVILGNYVSDSVLQQELQNYLEIGTGVENIAPGAVSIPALSQAVLDLINTSGGGSITNMPDDIDIETNSQNRLQLKGGGVVRFRVKSSAAYNYTELIRCIATGLPIQIENSIDLANSDGSIRDITFNGETLVFVGDGQIKNCHITGNVYIQANKTKIFDNVYFHHWIVNGTSQVNGSSIYGMVLADTNFDIYDRSTKTLSAADTSIPVNPFICSLTKSKIGNFVSPVLQDSKYVYKEGDTVVLTFDDDGSGNIKLPIRKDYLFLDNSDVVESTYDIKTKTASYTYVAASDLKISRLYAPTRVVDGVINGSVYPEWWGAKTDSSYDSNDAFQCAFLHGGDIQLSGDYFVSGNIRVYGNAKIAGNKHTIKLMANTSASCMLEVETLAGVQDGITIYDITLDGNKANNVGIQDGIFCDFAYGKAMPFDGYSMDNTYWYNLMVLRFRGSGICCAVPGTSHIYSSYLAFNGQDGITWDNEHFTLTNVSCWGNNRHGAYAGGNHWRIIGGAYAHNGAGDNIHCEGAFEAQIIGCSCIHCGKFIAQTGGGYIASSQNVYGYIWVGEGQGTHALVGGNGIHLKSCYNMTMIGIRVNNQNANGVLIDGGHRITISNSQFNANNMTKGEFSDINSNIELLYIDNSYYNSNYCVTNQSAINFGNSNGQVDWNDLKTDLKGFGQGVFNVNDYYSAQNRPAGAGSYLQGTIVVKNGISNTVGRTYIRLMDENCNIFVRYCNINYSNGIYTNDSGWKKITPTSV